jgi:hypothetical protein
MSRVWCGAAALAVLVGFAVALNPSGAADEKDPPIKEIMQKAHKGDKSLIEIVGKNLKEDKPDWDEVQKDSKELVKLGTSLGKNTPPKGEKDSWEKLTKMYLEDAKELDSAAGKKDKEKAADAHKKIKALCMDCHSSHRPK